MSCHMKKLVSGALVFIMLLVAGGLSGCSGLKTDTAASHYNKGIDLQSAGNNDAAILEYNQAIALDGKYKQAYVNRGQLYIDKQQYDLAVADYTEAITLDSTYAIAYNGRGAAYLYLKQYKQAVADFTQALKYDPGLGEAQTNLNIVNKLLGDINDIFPVSDLNGDWDNDSQVDGVGEGGNYGFIMYDGGSHWYFDVAVSMAETTHDISASHEPTVYNFTGTMQRTLVRITGPVTETPEIMQQIGTSFTIDISGTRQGSVVTFNFGERVLHLTLDGKLLYGDTHFFDAGSDANGDGALTDVRPPGVSGTDYIEWIWSIYLLKK
jgi:hypothetical protein